MHVTDKDMPRLFQTTDETARRERDQYRRQTARSLGTSILSAALAGLAIDNEAVRVTLTFLTMACLCVTIFSFFLIRNRQHDKKWYEARAMAESVKSSAWLFMTRAKPFDGGDADGEFLARLQAVMMRRKQAVPTKNDEGSLPQISERMREMRSLELDARKAAYVQGRVGRQLGWYDRQARENRAKERKWSNIVFACYLLALLSAASLLLWPHSPVRLTGLLTTLASSLLAWMQAGRNQELAQSYAWTAEQLSLMMDRSGTVATEEQLSEYVQEAESVISKEHSLWVARRE